MFDQFSRARNKWVHQLSEIAHSLRSSIISLLVSHTLWLESAFQGDIVNNESPSRERKASQINIGVGILESCVRKIKVEGLDTTALHILVVDATTFKFFQGRLDILQVSASDLDLPEGFAHQFLSCDTLIRLCMHGGSQILQARKSPCFGRL